MGVQAKFISVESSKKKKKYSHRNLAHSGPSLEVFPGSWQKLLQISEGT